MVISVPISNPQKSAPLQYAVEPLFDAIGHQEPHVLGDYQQRRHQHDHGQNRQDGSQPRVLKPQSILENRPTRRGEVFHRRLDGALKGLTRTAHLRIAEQSGDQESRRMPQQTRCHFQGQQYRDRQQVEQVVNRCAGESTAKGGISRYVPQRDQGVSHGSPDIGTHHHGNGGLQGKVSRADEHHHHTGSGRGTLYQGSGQDAHGQTGKRIRQSQEQLLDSACSEKAKSHFQQLD